MDTPSHDGLLTKPWLKAVGIVAGIIVFLWMEADKRRDQETVVALGLIAAIILVGVRLYRWKVHPFAGAAVAWNAGERARYIARQLAQRDRLLQLSPQQFEDAVAQLLRVRFGWNVTRTRYTADGGWDVEVIGQDGRVLIECKQYAPGRNVGRPDLQKLHSAIITEAAHSGALVTTSSFSEPARSFAEQTGIKLVDGATLSRLMREAYRDGVKADITNTMCSRCGQLVEFPAGHEVETLKCGTGHQVSNHLAESFRRANRRS